jgi:serine phosphatase RsbU (regulator of sigma subunit)/FixJ family two-component response regulator
VTATCISAPRALIADDQADVLEALRLLLKGEGYQTETVASPSAVLESLKQRRCDLLLMDLNYARDTTSGQEGMNLLSSVRAFDDTLPVIVMTAWANVDLAVEAMQKGSADFVQKPWENSRLLSILRRQVAQGRAARRARQLVQAKEEIGHWLISSEGPNDTLVRVCRRLQEAMQCDRVVIFTKSAGDQMFWAVGPTGTDDHNIGLLDLKGALNAGRENSLWDVNDAGLPSREVDRLRAAGIDALLPIAAGRETIGLLALGARRSEAKYDTEEADFLTEVAERLAGAISRWQVHQRDQESADAREIQIALLPKEVPHVPGCQVSAAWLPSRAVSGDFFDVFLLETGDLALCIADVAGKGTPAALLMSNLQAALKSFAPGAAGPGELCSKINRLIWGNVVPGKFITCFYGILDASCRKLTFTNAGHNHPIVVREDGSYFRLVEGGAVLGVFEEWPYLEGEANLLAGDRVVLFTDGITETRSREGDEFKESRLIDLLVENRGLDAARLQETIMTAVAEFTDGDLRDDATLIVLAID